MLPDWFELRSAAIMASAFALLMTFVLAAQYRLIQHVPGLGLWMAAAVLAPVGLALNNLQGTVPDWLAFPIALTALNAGLWCAWLGARQYSGRSPLIWTLALVSPITFVWSWYFSAMHPSFGSRSMLLSAVQVWTAANTAWLLARIEDEDVLLPLRFASVPMALYAVVAVGRLAVAVLGAPESGYIRTPSNTIAYVVGGATMVSAYMGMAMAMNAMSMRDVRREADHDALTGLLNRHGLKRRFEGWRARNRDGAVILIDVDLLKRVNDTLGHAEGDLLLTYLGQSIARLSDPPTLAARLGGDEFAILTRSASEARAIADACAKHFDGWCDKQYRNRIAGSLPSLSQGVAAVGLDLSSTLKAADIALYAAKSSGRHRTIDTTPGAGRPTETSALAPSFASGPGSSGVALDGLR